MTSFLPVYSEIIIWLITYVIVPLTAITHIFLQFGYYSRFNLCMSTETHTATLCVYTHMHAHIFFRNENLKRE